MLSNEERISRPEGINEEIRRELGGIHIQINDMRSEIRSTRNTLLMVNFLLWVATTGTMVGFFATQS